MSNRRNFLKILGTGMAAFSANPVLAGVARLKTNDRVLKIGMMMPQSNICPQYPYSFMNGFRQGIDQHKALKKKQIEIINESNGHGTPFLSRQNAQKLLFENNVDLVTGILGNEVTGQFQDLFTKKQVPFVVCNAGEYYPVRTLRENPFLFFNTLNLFQSAYMTGRYAVSTYGRKGLILTSFYDSGYDTIFAFTQGAGTSGGITETLVMKVNRDDFVSAAITRIHESNPDYIYILLNGDTANDFIIRLKTGLDNAVPMLTTPFVTEEVSLTRTGRFADGLESISPWSNNLDNPVNREFYKNYLNTYRILPDLYSMLGYETGLMIYRALAGCNGDFSGKNLAGQLSVIQIESPRGSFSVNQPTGWTNTPLYRLKVVHDWVSNLPHIHILGDLEAVPPTDQDFAALDNPFRSGWFNPYMFV